ncbi:putative nucleic acid-binding protein [Prauserella shujinwangii]|uniref:Ribonuclease VapC n=1 Tax=Prauserella shujinwangii TaxID=1453103 RepID=A0A2T0LUE2_9PSEU|nr:type II toxin-antitoxin system VapC family toxin [Prauserella shujinwangii]PRX47461.1 putative nucleic acid-binding protein [Prauserella shujinwangii]
MPDRTGELVVVDASTMVDMLAGTHHAAPARTRLAGTVMHAPAHLDAEVLSALGRLHRAGELSTADVEGGLGALTAAPLTRHAVIELAPGAWARRADLRLADALYVELAARLHAPLLTTDHRLARACAHAESITLPEQ